MAATPSSSRKSLSPTPDSRSLTETSTPAEPLTYAVREDEYADVDAEAGALLSDPCPDQARAAPWAKLVARGKRRLYRIPGVERTVDVVNAILGPDTRRSPPLPTSKSLLCAITSGRRRVSTSIDSLCVRFTRKFYLDYFWLLYLAIWIMGFVLLIRASYYRSEAPMIRCTATLWDDWPPDVCGVNGEDCYNYMSPGTYRCPGGCHLVPLGNPRWVGDKEVNGRPLLIGGLGGSPYRADSWICAAGIQQGLVSPTYGGCVRVQPLPVPEGSSNFIGGKANGLESASFAPHYPGAFSVEGANSFSGCMDYHWPITSFNVVMLFVFTAFFTPPPGVLATVLFLGGYLQLTLVSNPRWQPPNWSQIIGGVTAVLLAGYWAWRVSLRRTLTGFFLAKLPFETALWQGFGFWIGIESSTLFAKVPISRLGYNKLNADGVVSLVVIIILVVIVVLIQALAMRRLGLVRYYVVRYLPLVPIIIVCANLGHNYYIRPHHYLISLAGFPVLSLRNRISLFGQAFVTGYFLDGVGRWGWDSLVQGGDVLLGDAFGGSLLPNITTTAAAVSLPVLNSTFVSEGIDGLAIVFDDLLIRNDFNGTNFTISEATNDTSVDHYLRMAYIGNGTSMDFTDPLTWHATNQSWARVTQDMTETRKRRAWWHVGL